MFAAAASSVAELVFLDLEDATAPSQKEASRAKERNVAVCREAEARGLRAVGAAVVLVDAAHVKAAETTLARAALIDPTRLAPVR
jgi:citrate lyase beta subunit